MRRASAITVLAGIALSLVAPAALLQAETNLPACCRRNGAHHCNASAESPGAPAGIGFTAAPRRCASFPAVVARTASSNAALPRPSSAVVTTRFAHSLPAPWIEGARQLYTHRSHQKRGPPPSLL